MRLCFINVLLASIPMRASQTSLVSCYSSKSLSLWYNLPTAHLVFPNQRSEKAAFLSCSGPFEKGIEFRYKELGTSNTHIWRGRERTISRMEKKCFCFIWYSEFIDTPFVVVVFILWTLYSLGGPSTQLPTKLHSWRLIITYKCPTLALLVSCQFFLT